MEYKLILLNNPNTIDWFNSFNANSKGVMSYKRCTCLWIFIDRPPEIQATRNPCISSKDFL